MTEKELRSLWRRLIKELREEFHRWWEPDNGSREALQGKCAHAAAVLAPMIQGKLMRGFYCGQIDLYKGGPRWNWSEEFIAQRIHRHSWIEKDGKILDPTWWAFTNQPVGIYEFDADDQRYTTQEFGRRIQGQSNKRSR